jgi:hypothetical protein
MKYHIYAIFGCLFLTQSCFADGLISSYYAESDQYIEDLLVRCVEKHRQEKSNVIGENGLPVNQLDTAGVGISFASPYIGLELSSSENEIHHVSILGCTFERLTGELVAIRSANWEAEEGNMVQYAPKYDLKGANQKYGESDDTLSHLVFGLRLNYGEVMRRLKSEVDCTEGD